MPTILSISDALLGVIAAGIGVHYIFKKTETFEPTLALPLIFGVPATLTKFYLPQSPTIVGGVLTVFGTFWASLLASIAIYRLSPWHPLAKYPGPILLKLTKFRLAQISAGGKQYIYYQTLHQKYGNVVRVGPNELSICDADAINPLMGNLGLPKGQFWEGRVAEAEMVKPLIAIRDKTEHTRRRRRWTRAFSTAALKGYEEIVMRRVTQLTDTLAAQSLAEPMDLGKWISYFAYDVMSDLAFGGGSEMIAEGDTKGLWHLLEEGQKRAIITAHVPWLGKLVLRYPSFGGKEITEWRGYARKCALIRKKNGSAYHDIYHHLIDEDGVSSDLPSPGEIISDGTLVIIAGSDTTSNTLSHIFYFLMTHPTAYKRLQAEVDKLGGDVYDMTKLSHMPYLNSTINEGLRLLPPILCGSQHESVRGDGGSMVGPYYLPEGNSAFVPTYAIQRDPRYFAPLPESFIPERWLPDDQRMELEPKIFGSGTDFIHNTAAFIPFSFGPANCAGKNLALMELRLVITLIMHKFDLKLQDGYSPEQWFADIKDQFITLKGALPTILTARKQVI